MHLRANKDNRSTYIHESISMQLPLSEIEATYEKKLIWTVPDFADLGRQMKVFIELENLVLGF